MERANSAPSRKSNYIKKAPPKRGRVTGCSFLVLLFLGFGVALTGRLVLLVLRRRLPARVLLSGRLLRSALTLASRRLVLGRRVCLAGGILPTAAGLLLHSALALRSGRRLSLRLDSARETQGADGPRIDAARRLETLLALEGDQGRPGPIIKHTGHAATQEPSIDEGLLQDPDFRLAQIHDRDARCASGTAEP